MAGILLCHGWQARKSEGFASSNGQMENGNVLGVGRENQPGEQLGLQQTESGEPKPLSHPAASFLLALEEMGTSISSALS